MKTEHIDERTLKEEVLQSEQVYKGPIFTVRRNTILLYDKSRVIREIVEHRPGVVVLCLDEAGKIAFVKQWRTPVGRVLLELPAGGMEVGEQPETAASRELQEEVGLKPGTLELLHSFYVAPGWASELLHGFIARDCTLSELPADGDERISVEFHTLGKAIDLVNSGHINDAKSILMLQAWALRAVGPLGAKIWGQYRGE